MTLVTEDGTTQPGITLSRTAINSLERPTIDTKMPTVCFANSYSSRLFLVFIILCIIG